MRQDYIAVPVSLIENMCKALSEYELTDGDWKDCFNKIHDACVDVDAFCRDKLNVEALEQELCEDCISRADAIEFFKDDDYVVNELKNLVPVTPTEKVGHWIYDKIRYWNGGCKYECSECGMFSDVNYAYCMRCGCKMREVEE